MSIKTDTGEVQAQARGDRVFLNVHDNEFGDETYVFLKPWQARLIANNLLNAADSAEWPSEAEMTLDAMRAEGDR